MQFNKRVDLTTYPIVDTDFFDQHLEDVGGENLYVTFVAVNVDDATEAWQEEEDSFLWLVLPYEKVLQENPIQLMKEYLIEALTMWDWLDYKSLQVQVAEKLAA